MKHFLFGSLLFLFYGFVHTTHAQSVFKKPSVAVNYFYGSFLTHVPKAQYLRDSYSYSGEISIQRQTTGKKNWHITNRFPQVGVALFYGHTGSRRYMGNMAGVFPFVSWSLYKTTRFNSSLRAGAGLGWIEKPYNKRTNHKAVLIGTHGNAYINFLWQAEVKLFSNLHAAAGLSFSHFSNGSSTLPNLGLNIPSLSLGLRYQPDKTIPIPNLKPDSLVKKSSLSVFTTVGLKQFPWIESGRYLVNTLQLEWNRVFRSSGKYSGGGVLFYDRALEVDPSGIPDQKRKGNKIQAGVFAGYEHLFGRLSIPLQVGVYVYNQDIYSLLFQQLGFRYRINQYWHAQLSMKTHSGKADFIHAGIGYQLK